MQFLQYKLKLVIEALVYCYSVPVVRYFSLKLMTQFDHVEKNFELIHELKH